MYLLEIYYQHNDTKNILKMYRIKLKNSLYKI